MRALRVVGITEGGGEISVVLEDPGRRERFTVPADEQLRAAARGDLTRLGQIAIELESQLRPREIQARIRAGASVEQVATAAGVPLQKIERFAYPVLLERSRTAEVAQRAHPVRADGPDSRMLGDVVAHTFGLRGQEYADAEWDSWKGEDGKWIVALSWRAGRSDNRAHWTFQPGAHGGTVTAVDEHASDLVEGLPARPLRTVGPVIDIARPEDPAPAPAPDEELRAAASDTVRGGRLEAPREHASEARTVERGAPRTTPEPRRPMPPVQRQAPAEPQRPEPARPERARTDPAPTRRPERVEREEPVDEELTRREATASDRREAERPTAGTREAARTERRRPEPAAKPAEKPAERPAPKAEPPAAEQPAADAEKPAAPVVEEPAAAAAERPVADPEPPAAERPAAKAEPAAAQPAATTEDTAKPAAANRRTKKGKPVMPSWDEVLLGVRGQR
ncbi:septation protein SepH [Pseudonocardia sichuanensis]